MYDGTLPSDHTLPVSRLQRVQGAAAISIQDSAGAMRPGRLYQSGAAKIRLPKSYTPKRADVTLINTAGGLTGGDRFDVSVTVDAGACASVTTQACEKIYRSSGGDAVVKNALQINRGARLAWVPQETIFFDRAALIRDLTVDLSADGTLFALEPIVFGRAAMGEVVEQGQFRDAWTIRRDGTLIFADRTVLTGDIHAILKRGGVAMGATAYATGIYVGPSPEAVRDTIRDVAEPDGVVAGVSLVRDVVSFRAVAKDSYTLRQWIAALYRAGWGEDLPRVWGC